MASLTSLIYAQEERPQIIPGERKTPRKKDAGPRAVAVLQLAPNGKSSLIPIAILISGKFWDATAYKADPIPMALDPGNVYEVEQTGSSLGLFTVNNALHSNAQNTSAPWLGTGAWRPTGTEEPAKAATAENAPLGISSDDAPPRLTHDVNKQNAPPDSKAGSTSGASSQPASGSAKPGTDSPSGPDSGSGDDRPRLTKPSDSGATRPADSKPPANPPPAGQSDSKEKAAKPETPNLPTSDSGTNEANRPRLRRGKPAESFADEDVPGYSRPGATASTTSDKNKIVETAAVKSDLKLIPAISDAAGPPPHSFKFEWIRGDEEDRRKQMLDLAKQEIRAYVAAHSPKPPIAPKSSRTAAPRKSAAPEPILDNVQMPAFDLWNSNQPVIVLTATAHMPPASISGSNADANPDLQYSICLVTYPDIYNNLHKLYSGITDRFHLDVTPRLDLIDAVDADGDGRGELLFRQTSDAGSGWIIYRATADKLYKMFDSLNPE